MFFDVPGIKSLNEHCSGLFGVHQQLSCACSGHLNLDYRLSQELSSVYSGHYTKSVPRKAVDLDHSSTMSILYNNIWYLNESAFHEESDYVIIMLIQGSTI